MIKRIKVEFIKDSYFPRFKMLSGSKWEVRVDKLEPLGFPIGNGFAYNDQFKVVGFVR